MTKLVAKRTVPYRGKVYDLQIKNDPSYNISNIIVHNSAAGVLCGYLIDITRVDPIEYGLLFERFTNEGRVKVSSPDIDTDIEALRRGEVKTYVEQRYGVNRVCSIGTYTTFQLKQAITDISSLNNIPIGEVREFTKSIDIEQNASWEELFKEAVQKPKVMSFIQRHSNVIEDVLLIKDQPKAAATHACATLILPFSNEITDTLPVRKDYKENMIVSEWEGQYIESAGFLKEDLLGINQLDKFQFIKTGIKQYYGKDIDIYNIPLDDPKVFELFSKGYNGDVFHFGAKGLTKYSVAMKPSNIRELIAMIALFRPGPIENGFHMKYINIKNGIEDPIYYTGTEEITKETYSVICYQEQIMEICRHIGGFSLTQADDIRKAMGKKKKKVLDEYKEKFIESAISLSSYSREEADELWDAMEKFAGYAFNKCLVGHTILKRCKGGNNYYPTIAEMWKIKNDYKYAKETGHKSLHWRYKRDGYGDSWSLNEENKLIKNNIKDIRYVGERETFKVILESGKFIECTSNHKFPTSNGEKKLEDIDINNDLLFVSSGYIPQDTMYRFNSREDNTPKSGQQGFQKRDTSYTRLKKFLQNAKDINTCEICGCSLENQRKEVHHKDGDHGNNVNENLQVLCVSCHKKQHYKMGRTKMGTKGLDTHFEKIVKIESVGMQEVYDVEMDHPYHTLTLDNGIVTSNSHATCYAVTGYVSQWLKVHYPLIYWMSALTFTTDKKISDFLSEIYNSKLIKLKSININKSGLDFDADFQDNTLLWSISKIKQCGPIAVQAIFDERNKNGEFFSFEEFIERTAGGKVNKSVIENLIIAGAFDELENIKFPIQRKILIERYRELHKTKIDPEKDWYTKAIENKKIYHDWWWQLQQKKVSGFAIFDYFDLLSANIDRFNEKEYFDVDYLLKVDTQDQNTDIYIVSTGGVVSEYTIKESKRGVWMKIKLEQNYSFITLTLWADDVKKFDITEEILADNPIMLFRGRLTYDTFLKENALCSDPKSFVKFLK